MEGKQLEERILMLEDKYNMSTETEIGEDGTKSTFSLGKVHIFNNQEFDELPCLYGSDKDMENLKETFKKLNFSEPKIHEDLNRIPFQQEIEKIAKDENNELKKCRSFVCVFLSHGEDNHIYMKDGKVAVNSIYEEFSKSKNLQNKPKIFIFQACRGSKFNDSGICNATGSMSKVTALASSDVETWDERDASVESPFDSDGLSGTTPKGADCLTAYATTKGYVSFRDPNYGSWFIQKLCEVLQDYAAGKYDSYRPDLLKLLTLISHKVSRRSNFARDMKQAEIELKQMPSFVSSLRMLLFLRGHDNVAV